MILSTHFVTGAAVASYTDNPILLVILPIILHFVLDLFPHWQYAHTVSELHRKKIQLILDIVSGPLIIFLVLGLFKLNSQNWFLFFIAGSMGILPDGLTMLKILFPQNNILRKIYTFHSLIQPKKHLRFISGFTYQSILLFLALALITLSKA